MYDKYFNPCIMSLGQHYYSLMGAGIIACLLTLDLDAFFSQWKLDIMQVEGGHMLMVLGLTPWVFAIL